MYKMNMVTLTESGNKTRLVILPEHTDSVVNYFTKHGLSVTVEDSNDIEEELEELEELEKVRQNGFLSEWRVYGNILTVVK